MLSGTNSLSRGLGSGRGRARGLAAISVALLAAGGLLNAGETDAVSKESKRIIGAAAKITEANSGIEFMARVDTGAATCSIHVEDLEIENESPKRLENVGKNVRFLLKGPHGESKWVETKIVAAVRVKSSALKNGDFDRRYKVRLPLQWKDFRKEVRVTLNDRAEMAYPLLIGRNFLRGDFLVDVALSEVEDE